MESGYVGGRYVSNELAGGIPPELGHLEKLRMLSLSGSRLDGSIPAELTQLSSLATLDLNYQSVDGGNPSRNSRNDQADEIVSVGQ